MEFQVNYELLHRLLLRESSWIVEYRFAVENGVAVVPRSANVDHVAENVELFDFSLDRSQVEVLTELGGERAGREFLYGDTANFF